ncbi:hypothetical protein [Methylobacterium sp. Gmos1]
MSAGQEYWDGNDWEDHVLRLLQDMYEAHNVQKVPAKHKGDCGLDYFCLSKSVVYQCYAVEEPIDVPTRATKQKSKITTDIGKFCDPLKGAASMFNGHRIERWILAVPLNDSREVVEHALKKAAEVKAKSLSYVSNDFQILIHDRGDFDDETWSRRAQLRKRIRPIVPAPTQDDITRKIHSEQKLTENLREKLDHRFSDTSSLDYAVDNALYVFVEAENTKDILRTISPDAYEEVTRLISQRLRRISVGSRGGNGVDRLDTEIDGLRASILSAVPNLDPGIAEVIAFGAVSEWLMRCPLKLN